MALGSRTRSNPRLVSEILAFESFVRNGEFPSTKRVDATSIDFVNNTNDARRKNVAINENSHTHTRIYLRMRLSVKNDLDYLLCPCGSVAPLEGKRERQEPREIHR